MSESFTKHPKTVYFSPCAAHLRGLTLTTSTSVIRRRSLSMESWVFKLSNYVLGLSNSFYRQAIKWQNMIERNYSFFVVKGTGTVTVTSASISSAATNSITLLPSSIKRTMLISKLSTTLKDNKAYLVNLWSCPTKISNFTIIHYFPLNGAPISVINFDWVPQLHFGFCTN